MSTLRRTSKPTREAGFTLVELLVTMLLVGVIGSVVTASIVAGLQNARATSDRATALHDIERALQTVGREVRIAETVDLEGIVDHAKKIRVHVIRDNKLQIHTFSILAENGVDYLVQDIEEYALADVVGRNTDDLTAVTLPRRNLITDVDNDVEAIFTYHRRDGTPIPCDQSIAGDCEEQYRETEQIGIQLIRNLDDTTPIRAETRISIRNLRYGGL